MAGRKPLPAGTQRVKAHITVAPATAGWLQAQTTETLGMGHIVDRLVAREIAMTPKIDTTDTQISIEAHLTSGELYILRSASVWLDGECTGSTYVAAFGPLAGNDVYVGDRAAGVVRTDWREYADDVLDNQARHDLEDTAAWANEQKFRVIVYR